MSELDLDLLKAALEKATPRPWTIDGAGNIILPYFGPMTGVTHTAIGHELPQNKALIVLAVNSLPALIEAAEERDRLKKDSARLEAVVEAAREVAEQSNGTNLHSRFRKSDFDRLRAALSALDHETAEKP